MAIDKALLRKLKILYVEDDASIRDELSSLLVNFCEEVYTASDGIEGLNLYKEKQKKIDLIISDIRMPEMNGIEMLKEIRKFDKDVSVIFATAYSDKDFLLESIKLKVVNYIVKPIDVRALLNTISQIASIIYHKELLDIQNKELEKYKEAIDSNNIVIKTNADMKITYVNDHFCKITGYDKDELIGKDFIRIKHKDSDSDIYKDMYANILEHKDWHGKLKQITANGDSYVVDSHMITTYNKDREINGSISIQRDITKELNSQRDIQVALMKDKGEIFIKAKEGNAKSSVKILHLESNILDLENSIKKVKIERDRYVYLVDKYKSDIKKLKSELAILQNASNSNNNKSLNVLKIQKENTDLKVNITTLKHKIEDIIQDSNKNIKQAKVNLEIKIDDLEHENEEYKRKLEHVDNGEVLIQKIEYWKEKSKNEAKRIEELERKILQINDQSILNNIFGDTIK